MGKGTLVGVLCGIGAIFAAMIMEGGNPASLIAPPALLLIIVGSFGAACGGVALEDAIDGLKAMGKAFGNADFDVSGVMERLGKYAEIARRDGLLGLESSLKEEPHPLLRRGLQLTADSTSVDEARSLLIKEAQLARKVWKKRADFYSKLGGYGPTLGIIGTVLGLIHTLESLGGDPAELGHLIAAAFIATFFGVMFANIIFLPVGNKLGAIGEAEQELNGIIIEGVCGIASGKNPRVLLDQLASSLPEHEREAFNAAREQRAA